MSRVSGHDRPARRVSVRPLPEIQILEDIEAMSLAAALRFAGASAESIASKGTFSVALSGGSTPRALYRLLGSDRYIRSIDWQHVHLFWADERCVAPDHEQSNFKLARDAFLSKVPLPAGNVHRIRGEESPDAAAEAYDARLREFFRKGLPAFDLILLGVGEDGHTASLLPGSPALKERLRLAVAVYRHPPELNRVTLTLPVINSAHEVIFLVSGAAKASIVRTVLEDSQAKLIYPAAMVTPLTGSISWLIDTSAAALLNKASLSGGGGERRG